MKKLPLLLAVAMMLSACSHLIDENAKNLTPRKKFCRELKRNIIFNSTSTPHLGAASATQQAEMLRLYDKNGCGRLEKQSN